MKWEGGRRSSNVMVRSGTGKSLALGGGASLVLVVLGLLFGVNPSALLSQISGPEEEVSADQAPQARSEKEQTLREFVSVILADTEDTWPRLLATSGVQYTEPKLVLFNGAVQSACGRAGSSVGPFYCPSDQQVYLDLSFFDELDRRFGAPGDFAQAYVIAHEVAHHVQNITGIQARRERTPENANAFSVRLELQADCYAGVWAHHAKAERNLLESGDVEEGLRAASAIGDDKLQKRAQGYVVPESFTHGSSEQRVTWFRRGFESGSLEQCDTFRAARL